jgi:hypothetical protein
MRIQVEGNNFSGSLSGDAVGITACLFALGNLA